MTLSFDAERAAAYDQRSRHMIPGYETLHRLVDVCLAAELAGAASILTVGAGTGTEILESAPRRAEWRFTAVEPSPGMAAIGREKVGRQGFSDRVRWHEGPLETLNSDALFDAATLILVLHFIPDHGEKLDILEQIAERLKPGAPLFLASYVGDPQTVRTKKLYSISKAWAIAQGMSQAEADERLDPSRRDMHVVPEERIKNLLREAGYIDVQRVYQGLLIGGWIARTQR